MSSMLKQPSVKQIYAVLGIFILVAGGVSAWAVMKYRVDNHGVRIERVETEAQTFREDYLKQMTRVETRQEETRADVREIKDGVKQILERGGG